MEFQSLKRLLAVALVLVLPACLGDAEDTAEARAPQAPPPVGAVSAATTEAADAGAAILAAGGNAVDAAVAVSFALGVTEPAESGIGGAVTMLITAPGRPPVIIDGTPAPPAGAPGEGELTRHALVAVPTAVRVLETAWREHGSGGVEWEELLAPAIRLAEEGYPVGRFRHRTLVREYERLREDPAAASLLLDSAGTIPTEQATLPNPALARTLRRLAQEGPVEFYRGRIAETLVDEVEAGGGSLSMSDMTGLRAPPELEPLEGSYRGWTVTTLPSPYRGGALLRGLGLLERVPAETLATPGPERTQWITEALRFAFLAAGSDTAAGASPAPDVDAYLSRRPPIALPGAAPPPQGRRTSHFSVADGQGMAVAVGQSLGGPFGAGILSPELGFFLNRFVRPAGAAGGPTSTDQAPPGVDALGAVLRREGGDLLALGSPTGLRGAGAVIQVVSAVVDAERALRDAVAIRRLHRSLGAGGAETLFLEGTSWSASVPELGLGPPGPRPPARPRSPFPDSVRSDTTAGPRVTTSLNPRAAGAALRAEAHAFFGDSVAPVLRARGFGLGELDTGLTFEGRDPWFGRVQAVARIGGVWEAAADPRSDGNARILDREGLTGTLPPVDRPR